MLTRFIPASNEPLPVIGLGTYRGFDVDLSDSNRARLSNVLQSLFSSGGRVIDSSPMYGQAEEVVGELLAEHGDSRVRPFLATKVWIAGRDAGVRQIEQSFRLLRTDCIDLMQIHNLLDWKVHLPTLLDLKEAGRIRYIGITHYSKSAYAEIENILKAVKLDFLQINYALNDRAVESRILPLALDRGVAVIANMPFGGGDLLRQFNSTALPGWAEEVGARSWPQLAIKFVLAHPAITNVIPGTGNPDSMEENAEAACGPGLSWVQRQELINLI